MPQGVRFFWPNEKKAAGKPAAKVGEELSRCNHLWTIDMLSLRRTKSSRYFVQRSSSKNRRFAMVLGSLDFAHGNLKNWANHRLPCLRLWSPPPPD